ncbi:hypothetical protein DFH06DRAFT_1018033 [Mycena polygramma]|nr:hypothetical protein DFH06DRAFT_1019914 [Mycena polygramma]KAJ7608134.1 hypothetical protein DFH06DRAFT_1018033 [Mycena polygramma]
MLPQKTRSSGNKIQQFYETHQSIRKPDIMGGDTNIVKDAIDRLPASSSRGYRRPGICI